MTTATKIKVGTVKRVKCRRCRGTGMTGFRALHLGVPGLCCACDGDGTVERLTAEQKRARKINRSISHLAEIEEQGKTWRTAADHEGMQYAITGNKPPRIASSDQWHLDQLRSNWIRVNAELTELLAN